MDDSAPDGICLREALDGDIPALAWHHRMMFDEIWAAEGRTHDPIGMAAAEQEYAGKLACELPEGTCRAWIIEEDDRIVSSGAVSIVPYVPVPHDPQPRIAFLHSIYTEPECRQRHYARAITEEAARHCREQGLRRFYLFASRAGRPLYESLGFQPVENMMMLYLG